jgi:hypothetical protein
MGDARQRSDRTMAYEQQAKQFSFRLPAVLIERLEACIDTMQRAGLDLTRADVVRLLLNHALDNTQCRPELLLRGLRRPRQ